MKLALSYLLGCLTAALACDLYACHVLATTRNQVRRSAVVTARGITVAEAREMTAECRALVELQAVPASDRMPLPPPEAPAMELEPANVASSIVVDTSGEAQAEWERLWRSP